AGDPPQCTVVVVLTFGGNTMSAPAILTANTTVDFGKTVSSHICANYGVSNPLNISLINAPGSNAQAVIYFSSQGRLTSIPSPAWCNARPPSRCVLDCALKEIKKLISDVPLTSISETATRTRPFR